MSENRDEDKSIENLLERMIRQGEEFPMIIIKSGETDQAAEENQEPEEGVI